MSDDCAWSVDQKARLTELWKSVLSTAAIGLQMGMSKNAIVGKAHRMGLPARPSPIKRGAPAKAKRSRKELCNSKVTLPPLESAAMEMCRPPPCLAPISASAVFDPLPLPPRPRVAAIAQPCCWPIGEPGTRSFRYCDAETYAPPYCDEHHARAHVRIPLRSRETIAP